MHPALRLLMLLQARGWLRRQITGGSRLRRLARVIGVVLFGVWIATRTARGIFFDASLPARVILDKAPYYIAALACLPLVFGNEDRALAFTPAELDFLFPGPFHRRDLAVYKLVRVAIASAFGAVFATLGLHTFVSYWPAAFFGASQALLGINLFATVITLLREVVAERSYKALRWSAGVVLVAIVGGIAIDIRGLAGAAGARAIDAAVVVGLAPARVYAHILAAPSLVELAPWFGLGLLVNGAMVAAVLLLDKGYVQAALTASYRRQQILDRVSKGSLFATSGKSQPAMELRVLRFLGPAGAIVRRHAVTAIRTSRSWLFRLVLGIGFYGFFLTRTALSATPVLTSMALFLVILFPQMMRFDFRGDVDHLDALKALPIPFRAVAVAELAVPTVMFSALAAVLGAAGSAWLGLGPLYALLIALAAPPVATAIIALENFVFLLLPSRLFVPGQGTLFFSTRRMLLMFLRLVLFTVGGGLCTGVGAFVWWTTGSVVAAYGAAWVVAALTALVLVEATARAFRSFDVSLDLPT